MRTFDRYLNSTFDRTEKGGDLGLGSEKNNPERPAASKPEDSNLTKLEKHTLQTNPICFSCMSDQGDNLFLGNNKGDLHFVSTKALMPVSVALDPLDCSKQLFYLS